MSCHPRFFRQNWSPVFASPSDCTRPKTRWKSAHSDADGRTSGYIPLLGGVATTYDFVSHPDYCAYAIRPYLLLGVLDGINPAPSRSCTYESPTHNAPECVPLRIVRRHFNASAARERSEAGRLMRGGVTHPLPFSHSVFTYVRYLFTIVKPTDS